MLWTPFPTRVFEVTTFPNYPFYSILKKMNALQFDVGFAEKFSPLLSPVTSIAFLTYFSLDHWEMNLYEWKGFHIYNRKKSVNWVFQFIVQ
jgi:hypothetical protein